MKYLNLLFLMLFISINGNAQTADSLFSTYTNKDLLLRQLTFSGSLSGGNDNDRLNFNFFGNVKLNYSQFINRNKLQSDFSAFINLQHSKIRYNDIDNPLTFESVINPYVYNKSRYYTKTHFFFGYGYNASYFFIHRKNEDYPNTSKVVSSNDHLLDVHIPLSIGTGRKYPVYSIHKSLWIYSELNKNKTLKRKVNDQDVEQLSNLLDENVYTRIFDYRTKSIQDLTKIDSLLNKQDMITVQNMNYFTTLYDMYFYSSGSSRFRGSSLEGGINTLFFYYSLSTRTKTEIEDDSYKLAYKILIPVFFVEYQKFKPIDLHWQFDLGIRAEFGFHPLINDQNNVNSPVHNRRSLEGNTVIHYYPNTRSYFILGFAARYGNKYSNSTQYPYLSNSDYSSLYLLKSFSNNGFINTTASYINSEQFNYWTTILELLHYYYVSPQFRIQSDLTLYYSDDTSPIETKNKLNTNISFTFSYAIF
jgi:hypothetical protein